MVKKTAIYGGKIVLLGILYFVGTIAGGMVSTLSGLVPPELPAGTDMGLIQLYTAGGGLVLALALSYLASRLDGRFAVRWLALTLLVWLVMSVNNVLEASIFTTGQATLFGVVTQLGSSLFLAAGAAWLFRPAGEPASLGRRARSFFANHTPLDWTWRFAAVLLAFPAIYLFFGVLIEPLIGDYYREQIAGLTLPTMGEIIALQFLRSLIFLLAVLPLIVLWRGGRTSLFVALGGALFLLVGGVPLFQAYWLPVGLRLVHSGEILADSFVHAAALVFFLVPQLAADRPRDVALA